MFFGKRLHVAVIQGEPLMQKAMDVLLKFHEAQGGLPVDQVEELRVEAEFFFQAVSAYQFRVLAGAASTLQ
ncbi:MULTISPECIES: hypothetical protein [Pseudomonas]|jgi:hypothetical protein|uniref:Uncharacterized protein n=1 Tax=Pseudomonas putida (strain W619) TaxID=390235 RepID=B1JB79_PSEPW|nr:MULTISPECIES: hypothetical protein [Pseudomonas]ERT19176.1 hypothetical protein O162_07535 [Pseudomonas putida SJ3]AJG12520.1 hypothetical protein RK21_01012 [Pseudomonas plecoglossicida]EKT4450872.1 hypothetical protein [Pseudomonas putida]KSG00439.1 hypothetical protein AO945_18255 [Pseudomonas aeruginosa]KSO26590.1 hypothetical protein APA91_14540 [Pseudomonas aeruginosa]